MPTSDDPFLLTSSPSSSPPSSPSFGPIDSSPPSSPSIAPISTPPASPRLSHPFAASTKATRRPHLYEKRERLLGWASNSSPERSVEARDKPQARRVPVRRRSVESSEAAGGAHQLLHRYAASAKSSWKPPHQEREITRVVSDVSWASGSGSFKDIVGSRRVMTRAVSVDSLDGFTLSDDEDPFTPPSRVSQEQRERETWDQAITAAIDSANGTIILGAPGLFKNPLHYIPPSIADLSKLVVLPTSDSRPAPARSARVFARSSTVPASDASFWAGKSVRGTLALGKAASFTGMQAAAEPPLNEIQLILENNAISILPLQLFSLAGLTVLNLRGNRLDVIPPQIMQLNNMRELNIAQNNLRWLPAEMLKMRLAQLSVYPNPWMLPPEHNKGAQTRRVSQTTVRFAMLPLSESCLRQLLAPAPETAAADPKTAREPETRLEALYGCPLTGTERLAPALLETLRACVPRAFSEADGASTPAPSPAKVPRRCDVADVHSQPLLQPEVHVQDVETHPGIGVCPAPEHDTARVYVQWAEERFTWECVVAGRSVSSLGGPGVPVRWRGCGRGCLDFLDAEAELEEDGDVDPDTDVDMSGDQSGDEGVQILDFGIQGLADVDTEEFE